MAHTVLFSKRAEHDWTALEPRDQEVIRHVLDSLAGEPRPSGCKKLKGEHSGSYRVRAGGDFRLVYDVNDHEKTVVILRIGNRREVYDR